MQFQGQFQDQLKKPKIWLIGFKLIKFGILLNIDMIPVLFNILLFLIPLIFFKNTSELFEFNKIVTLYALTTIITSIWVINSIKARKFIFKRTLLDWPLVIYLFIYLISSLLSIDPRTSWLGYYSRFNGGLISQICYVLLYWAFVSNMTAKQSRRSIVYSLLSTAIASVLATLEHFGIFTTCGLMGFGWKESCWVQDVQSRVFSTLGQPNWLACIISCIDSNYVEQIFKQKEFVFYSAFSAVSHNPIIYKI